ncbi:MAG TPA: glucose 1-dehydrogenase [Polyangia bacterium]|nr:glucose 1-dehydrogenase [Polyangia bacterium]
MRAIAMFPTEKKIRLVDRPSPQLEGAEQARVRMLEVGVCGTDHEIARFEYGAPPPGEPYLVIGHESLGEVLEVGSAVSNLKPGDLVVTTVRRPCGIPECRPCHHNRPDFCVTGAYTERGIMRRHGFMTDEIVDLASNMHLVPREIADIAVLTEPLTIAEKALIELDSVLVRMPWINPAKAEKRGMNAVVLGAGPVGLLGALALLVRGFDTWIYSRESASSPRADWVDRIGARYIESGKLPVGDLGKQVGNVDLIYEATGSAALAFAALPAIGKNGVFIFTGVPGHKTPVTLAGEGIMRNLVLGNQLLYGTVNAGPPSFDQAIADLVRFDARWPGPVRELITGHFAPEQITDVLSPDHGGIKNVIRFGTPIGAAVGAKAAAAPAVKGGGARV